VDRAALRVARYRFRATFRRRSGSYLALVLLVGLVGGLGMGSAAAARRTQSSFPVYLASTHPADLEGITSFVHGGSGAAALGFNPVLMTTLAHLRYVKQFTYFAGLNLIPLNGHGVPESPPGYPAQVSEASGLGPATASTVGGSVVQGRMFDPARPGEFVVTAAIARTFHWRVGDVVRFAAYTNAQAARRSFGSSRLTPHRTFKARLVGIVIQSQAVVEDQVDAPGNADLILFTPARTRSLLSCCTYYSGASVDVLHADRNIPTVAKEIQRTLPAGFSPFATGQASAIDAKAERAIKPESIALGVFGGIAVLAALLIAAQLIGRQLRLGADETATLRALGASPEMTASDGLIGIVGAVFIGAALAVGVAIGLSPLSPLGPVRPVYPTPGVAFDWAVLSAGFAVLALGLGTIALVLSYRTATYRTELRRKHSVVSRSKVVSAAASSGFPPTAVTGIRFAVEPGSGRSSVPVRSAIIGATLALLVGIATVTFGSSLDSLVSHPALYGWNWSYELTANQGGVVPGAHITKLLNRDSYIASWSSIDFATLRIDGQPEPVLAERSGATVAPPLLSGHGVQSNAQIVLGTVTLGQLHKHVGDLVTVTNGVSHPSRLRIVGTATLPTIGVGGNQHAEMGTGALVPNLVLPSHSNDGYQLSGAAPGPDAVLVRLKRGDAAAGLRSLRQIARATSTPADYGVSVLSVQRPAEIVNYRAMGTTPVILGAALAAGAMAALGLTLVASVRRRQRDLALLRTFGFTRRQLAVTVAWQASIAVGIGTIVGIPFGIIVGRLLWNLFAHEISVVPSPTVPMTIVVLIALGGIVLGNLVAALPARMAARTSTALLLRAE
jgi:hypothetical protein